MPYLNNISYGNEALEFIDNRIIDKNYRGNISSEHNRYDREEIWKILKLLDEIKPNQQLLRIRDTDLSKRPRNTPEESDYALFCDKVKNSVNKGTQDSIRKNIFVDLERMGLIKRYDINGEEIIANDNIRKSPKYVSLSEEGTRFINQMDVLSRQMIFTKAINKLLNNYINITLYILENDYNIKYITIYEFMFFVSAVNTDTNFNINIHECIKLIKSYRQLSLIQQSEVVRTLERELKPSNFKGDKTTKKDWHNWKNKIEQIYHLFSQSPYFNIVNNKIKLGTREVRTESGKVILNKNRNIQEKQNYFKNHRLEKRSGFELHHVIPLLLAENPDQYKLLDNWQNMVYIDAYKHSCITQNGNRNILMFTNNFDIILKDYSYKNETRLEYKKNILYDLKNQQNMLSYNKKILETNICGC